MIKERRFSSKRTMSPDQKKQVRHRIAELIKKKSNIAFAYIHGSFAADGAFRDIDVSVFFIDNSSLDEEIELASLLSKKIKADVDVTRLNQAPIYFQASVITKGNLLFSRNDNLWTDFLEKTGRKYREYAHFRNLYLGIEGMIDHV